MRQDLFGIFNEVSHNLNNNFSNNTQSLSSINNINSFEDIISDFFKRYNDLAEKIENSFTTDDIKFDNIQLHAYNFRKAILANDELAAQEYLEYLGELNIGVLQTLRSFSRDEIVDSLDILAKYIPFHEVLKNDFFHTLGYDLFPDDLNHAELLLELKNDLIKAILDNGTKVNFDYEFSNIATLDYCALAANKELLISHPNSSLTLKELFSIALSILEARITHDSPDQQEYYSLLNIKKDESAKKILKFVVENGIDLNTKLDKEELMSLSFGESLFTKNIFEFFNENNTFNLTISSFAWGTGLDDNPGIEFPIKALEYFPNSFISDNFIALTRSHGAANTLVQKFLNSINIAQDYIDTKNGIDQSLNEFEMSLLSNNELPSFESYENAPLINKYGYTSLQLALLGKKLTLATEMIKSGADVVEPNSNRFTALLLIKDFVEEKEQFSQNDINNLTEVALKNLTNVDIISDDGESLVDSFIKSEDLREEILERTNDPLFQFFKEDSDLLAPSLHSDLIHIAISHGKEFWSSGIWSWARLAKEKHPNIKFHLVNLEMLEKGGDAFVKQFDGWINPGGGDDYPKDKSEFTFADWQTEMELIETYQKALSKTFEYSIPYIGMCAGAQNIVLHHNGSLHPLKGYNSGQHTIEYLEGTLAHFMAMSQEQQHSALKNCEFAKVSFKGDTAHNFAGVANKLGENIELGAISEHGVAMSYAHTNGLRYATQFHPEHNYNIISDSQTNHEKIWLDNFIHLATMHHDARVNGGEHPEVLFQNIYERLNGCTSAPTCTIEPLFNNATLQDSFFGF